MKKIHILLFLMVFGNTQAQTKNELIGKWTFTKVLRMDLLDAAQIKKMDSYVTGNWYLDFRKDGSLIVFPEKSNQTMTWQFDEQTKQIILHSNGNRLPLEIIQFKPKTLRIKMGIDEKTSGEFELQKK